jgi:RNA polymerase sigma factor (TIGR02999 family)
MAAEMRRRLIDHARRRLAEKRGGRIAHSELKSSQVGIQPHMPAGDLEATFKRLDQALEELTHHFPRAARVVQLRFLCDLTIEAIAVELALSPGTVKRDWTFARAWLAAALEGHTEPT